MVLEDYTLKPVWGLTVQARLTRHELDSSCFQVSSWDGPHSFATCKFFCGRMVVRGETGEAAPQEDSERREISSASADRERAGNPDRGWRAFSHEVCH
jgi:hypothetical protein